MIFSHQLVKLMKLAKVNGRIIQVKMNDDYSMEAAYARNANAEVKRHSLEDLFEILQRDKSTGQFGPVINAAKVDPSSINGSFFDVFYFLTGDEKERKLCSTEITFQGFQVAKLLGKTVEEALGVIRVFETLNNERNNNKDDRIHESIQKTGSLILSQDNLGTKAPFFVVYEKVRVFGVSSAHTETFTWVNEDGDDACEEAQERMNSESGYGESVGFRKIGFTEVDRFVTGCLTSQAAQKYLQENAHNLNKPFVYVESLHRNQEMINVRNLVVEVSEAGDNQAESAPMVSRARESA